MKKKLIAILLAATCALTAGLTGCSGNAATSGTDESKTSDAQSTGDSTAKSDVVAGFVYIGKINDGGYTQAHDAGRLAVEAMGVKTFYVEDLSLIHISEPTRPLSMKAATLSTQTHSALWKVQTRWQRSIPM